MRAKAPIRSVATLTLEGLGSPIDLKLYKKCGEINGLGIERHLYHETDRGKIRRIQICEECDEAIDSDQIITLADMGDNLIPLDNSVVAKYWGVSDTIRVISCPPTDKVFKAMLDDTICLNTPYIVSPVDPFDERSFDALLSSLKDSNKCVIVEISIKNQVRRGVLFPNGTLYSLYYENEIRENKDRHRTQKKVSAEILKEISGRITKKRSSVGKAIPKIDLEKAWDDLATGS